MAVPFTVRIPVLLATVYGSLYLVASRAPYYPEKYPNGFWNMQGRLGASVVWLKARQMALGCTQGPLKSNLSAAEDY